METVSSGKKKRLVKEYYAYHPGIVVSLLIIQIQMGIKACQRYHWNGMTSLSSSVHPYEQTECW